MELLLLGTGAAEGWPAPFCTCPHCEEVRRRGGVNVRARSGSLVDEDLKIDFGPDTAASLQRCGRTLARVRTILITHQHTDHLTPAEFEWTIRPFTQTPAAEPIQVFGNAASLDLIRSFVPHGDRVLRQIDLREIRAGSHFTTATGDEVWAMPADHCEGAMVFRVRRGRDGRVLFQGHDSGLYPAATLDGLSDGVVLDVALLDCTNGPLQLGDRGHMGIAGVVRMRDELARRGAVTERTRVIATHFSHNGGYLHEDIVRAFLPHRIEVAFDGMTVRV